MDAIFDRHSKIALQFSGGRDSLACLYILRPYWDRLTVYWCDTGAAFPETIALAKQVCDMVPHFAMIAGAQPQVIEQFGMPSDLVPVSRTPIGQQVASKADGLIQDRYSCCVRSMILPVGQRMIEDGITLIIRGQRQDETLKWPMRSGDVQDNVEYLFPIEDWDSKKVMTYLREQDAPIPRFYEMLDSAPDCMSCTAYWEEGAAKYLKRYHHEQYLKNQSQLDLIQQAVSQHIAAFNQEISP